MIPNIVSGARMHGLSAYLFGPGRANEHTNPHVVAASSERVFAAGGSGLVRDESVAGALADAIDEARIVFGTEVVRQDKGAREAREREGWPAKQAVALAEKHEHVWHCSLSLSPEEGPISEEKWAHIATVFMQRMGFTNVGGGVADAQWAAVHHGGTKDGGDHIHIMASRVRDDGTIVPKFLPYGDSAKPVGDFVRAQRISADLEREFGLRVTQGRAAALTQPGQGKGEAARAGRSGAVLTEREELARRVRACAGSAANEGEFVAAVRRSGVRIRPRYAKGSTTEIVGYSVALPASVKGVETLSRGSSRMASRDKAIWYGGGRLAKDLTLTQLRNGWGSTEQSQSDALPLWQGRKPDAARRRADRDVLQGVQQAVGEFSERVAGLSPDDHQGWYEASRTAAGMLSQLSLRDGGDPQLAAAARALDACSGAMVPRPLDAVAVKRRGSMAHATMLMGLALHSGNTKLMFALVLKQLSDTCRAIADARAAGVDAERARALRVTAETTLARYQHALAGVGGEAGLRKQILTASASPPRRSAMAAAAAALGASAPAQSMRPTRSARPARGSESEAAVPPRRRLSPPPDRDRGGSER